MFEIEIAEINLPDIVTALKHSEAYLELKNNIEKAINESSDVVVITASDILIAANYISNYKRITKEINNLRKKIVQPLVDKKAEVDAFFKAIPEMYEDELKRLEKEVLEFKKKTEEEARRKAEEERRRLEEEAIEKAIKEGREEIPIIPEVIPQTHKISQLNSSKVTTRRTKTFRIVDESKIPREYLTVDEKKIRAERMKYDYEAKSTIPGVEFTFEETVV